MHYTPNGSEQQDQSRLGLTLVDSQSVTHESISIVGINHDLEIPPQQAAVEVAGSTSYFPKHGKLLSIAPHMHLRGKAVTVQLQTDSGTKTILEVPHYDFNWQHTYLLAEPIELDDVSEISFTATFDNSPNNPFNPDPFQFVTWGDQTWEEMAIVFYEVSKPLNDKQASSEMVANQSSPGPDTAEEQRREQERRASHDQQANSLLTDLDTNRDGIIEYDEVSLAVKWRLFNQLDLDGDRRVDRAEIMDYLNRYR